MKPEEITLDTPSKAFEFEKASRAIDEIKDVSALRELAKSYVKLYMKQQEVIGKI
jgi:hypothetical protein|tara:strand:+ start:984 stop:1148 length:165 start_codon:yes stop_codon:yes gene_type:complete